MAKDHSHHTLMLKKNLHPVKKACMDFFYSLNAFTCVQWTNYKNIKMQITSV